MSARSRTSWRRRLTPLVGLMGLGILGAVVLSLIPMPGVEFGLQGRTQSIGVVLAESASIDAVPANESTIQVTEGAVMESLPDFSTDKNTEIVLKRGAGLPFTLSAAELPARWHLSIESPPLDALRIIAKPENEVQGFAQIEYTLPKGTSVTYQKEGETRTLTVGQWEKLTVKSDSLDLRIRPFGNKTPLFVSLKPSAVSFETIEQQMAGNDDAKAVSVGTMDEGVLWIAHKGEQRRLTLVDRLSIKGIGDGLLRPLVSEPEGLRFGLRGKALQLVNTPGIKPDSLKPSLLDYLIDNGLLKIIAAIVSFIIGIEVTNLVRRK